MEKVGLIGLGVMGKPIAFNLAAAGVQLFVNDIRAEIAAAVADECGAVYSLPEQMAAECDVIFTSLPDGEIARKVITGDGGLFPHLREGSVVVDMSSVTPQDSRFCARRLMEKGVDFLDAPVSGGEEGAIKGSLAIMVGGKPEVYERVRKYFDIIGSRSVLVGDTGSGSTAKLANQIIVNLNIATVSEAMVFVKKAGGDPQKVFEAIRFGLAGSRVLEDKMPRMLSNNFAPGGSISINYKDIGNVLSTARELGIPVPMSASLFEIMQSLRQHGYANEDHAAILHYFASITGIESL